MSSPSPEAAPYIGALFRLLWQRMRDEAHLRVAAAGFPDVQPAHLQVFRLPSPEGVRPSDLAARLQISKQSVNDLLGHLEEHGYLTREADPSDGRGRVVRLTAKGRRLEDEVHAAGRLAEAETKARLGASRYEGLLATLNELARDA
jgi:DNA-binding MarR family transcriptional regulator